MKILIVGGGGREHAILCKIRENPKVTEIYALPGNGGMAEDATCVPIAATDIPAIVAFALDKAVDFAIVAPDDPLVLGAVDALTEKGIPCFGPSKGAALIEGSKSFAKDMMAKYGIPTAAYRVFDEMEAALAYAATCAYPLVVKADGLALGKGVVIAENRAQGEKAIRDMMAGEAFGPSGHRVVLEAYLQGPEVTVLCFADGKTLLPMVSSMDHKRALDGDLGPNTGGMGVICPSPYYTEDVAKQCMETIFLPTMAAMAAEGRPFRGCLYFGLMITADGPKVIEYNCRFGDPEAQAVLSLLNTDLLTIMEATAKGRLSELTIKWKQGAACVVMVVSGGYPGPYEKGKAITLDTPPEGVTYLHSGTARGPDGLVTAGGRVIGVTATAETLAEAIDRAYQGAAGVAFSGAFYRRDIGKGAWEAMKTW